MRVVVATNNTETARQGVEWAAVLAERFDGELVLLDTVPTGDEAQPSPAPKPR